MGRQFVVIAALLAVLLVIEFTPSCYGRTLAKGKDRISKQDDATSAPPPYHRPPHDSSDVIDSVGSGDDDSTHDSYGQCEDEMKVFDFLQKVVVSYYDCIFNSTYAPDSSYSSESSDLSDSSDSSAQQSANAAQESAKKSVLSLTRRLAAVAKKNRKVKDGSDDECEGLQWVIGDLIFFLSGDDFSDYSNTASSSRANSLSRRLAAAVKKNRKVKDGSVDECKELQQIIDILPYILIGDDISSNSASSTSDEQSLASRLIAVAKKNHKESKGTAAVAPTAGRLSCHPFLLHAVGYTALLLSSWPLPVLSLSRGLF